MKTHAQQGEFTGRHMLIIMVAFFGVVISVNTLMAVLATKSWTGIVVKNSYVASQQFNAETTRRMQAITAGAKADLAAANGWVTITFTGKTAEPLAADGLVLSVGHPVDPSINKSIYFTQTAPGVFKTEQALPPGTWVGEASATLKGYGVWVHPVRLHITE